MELEPGDPAHAAEATMSTEAAAKPKPEQDGHGWHVVPGFACRPRYARVCDGFCGRARGWTAPMSRADLYTPGSPQTGSLAARRVADALWFAGPPLLLRTTLTRPFFLL